MHTTDSHSDMASPLVDVYVKLPTGRTSTVQLISSETVNSILEHVAKEEGVSAGRVRLKYQGKILDKTKSIGYLGICPETILKGEVTLTLLTTKPCRTVESSLSTAYRYLNPTDCPCF